MSAEGIPPRETAAFHRAVVVQAMKENPANPEAAIRLEVWKAQQDARVKEGELTRFAYHLELARLYRDAGWIDDAEREFGSCVDTARLLNFPELAACEAELAALKSARPE